MMQREDGTASSSTAWGRRLLSIFGWGALVYLVLAALLAFVAPDFARNMAQQKLSVDPYVARIDHLSINPLTLAVEAEGFALSEGPAADPQQAADGVLLAFDRLRVDISPWALVKRAIGFDEIALTRPRVGIELDREQQLNWQRYVDKLQASLAPRAGAEPAAEASDDDELPRLLVDKLLVEDVDLSFVDHNKPGPFKADFGPLSLEVLNLSTLIGDDATYTLSATTTRSELLAWNGSLSLNPLRSAGSISVSGWRLPVVWDYFRNQVKFEVASGSADISGQYEYDGNLLFSNGVLELADIVVLDRAGGDAPELIELPGTRLGGMVFDLDGQRLDIANVDITGLRVRERIDPAGNSCRASVLSPATAVQPAGGAKPAGGEPSSQAGKAEDAAPGKGTPRTGDVPPPAEPGAPVPAAEGTDPAAADDAAPATAPAADTNPVDAEEAETSGGDGVGAENTGSVAPEPEPSETGVGEWVLRLSPIAGANASTTAAPAAETVQSAAEAEVTGAQLKPGEGEPATPLGEQAPGPASAPELIDPSESAPADNATISVEGEAAASRPVKIVDSRADEMAEPAQPVAPSAAAAADPGSALSVGIGLVALTDAAVTVQHQVSESITNVILLEDIAVAVEGFEFPGGDIQSLTLETRINGAGQLSLEGKGDIDPLQADFQLQLDGFELAALMPYVEPLLAIELESGSVAAKLNGSLAQRAERLDSKVNGEITFSQLLVNEAKKGTPPLCRSIRWSCCNPLPRLSFLKTAAPIWVNWLSRMVRRPATVTGQSAPMSPTEQRPTPKPSRRARPAPPVSPSGRWFFMRALPTFRTFHSTAPFEQQSMALRAASRGWIPTLKRLRWSTLPDRSRSTHR